MKEVKFVPDCFNKGVFTGHVVIKKPSVNDLFEGSAIAKGAEADPIEANKKLINWSSKFYVSIDIKCIDGTSYQKFDDLMDDAECLIILNEVAEAIVSGINAKKLQLEPKVGKKL